MSVNTFLFLQMRAVSSELEVLGRHDHPHLTVPFLKVLKNKVLISDNMLYLSIVLL